MSASTFRKLNGTRLDRSEAGADANRIMRDAIAPVLQEYLVRQNSDVSLVRVIVEGPDPDDRAPREVVVSRAAGYSVICRGCWQVASGSYESETFACEVAVGRYGSLAHECWARGSVDDEATQTVGPGGATHDGDRKKVPGGGS